MLKVVLGRLVVSVFAIGPMVRAFKPGREDGILGAIKSAVGLLQRGIKAIGPM
jgi:hypothetical protein